MLERVVDGTAERAANGGVGTLPVLDVVDVVQTFRSQDGGRVVNALSHVSFQVHQSETLAIVGESGSGKTTLARAIVQQPPPSSGRVLFRGHDLTRARGRRLKRCRNGIHMIFQDSFSSLNPRWRVCDIVEEPLVASGGTSKAERRIRVEEVLELVRLPMSRFGQRRPGELSGGQCQRVAIARAVASRPSLVVCDEAVSSLDVLIQAQILSLFEELQEELGLSYLFISHDLRVVKQISDRIAVLYRGQLCEIGPTHALFGRAGHPYTRALLDYVRSFETRRNDAVEREAPPRLHPPSGCRFRARCLRARRKCETEEPGLAQVAPGHFVACHFPE